MQAETLPTKKAVHKGKIKKSLKNVLCRPDPVFWPNVSENQQDLLKTALSKHKVEIPKFQKPQWKELKLIPKEKRPKPPQPKRIEGLIFGISECCSAINDNSCAAIVVEGSVNPRAIVQPVIEGCINSQVPVICVNGLRSISASNFGIPTSCLGIKCGSMLELRTVICDLAKNFKMPPKVEIKHTDDVVHVDDPSSKQMPIPTISPYLYRSSKKTRVFNPSEEVLENKHKTDFSGQDFIEFAEKKDPSSSKEIDRKAYMKMVLKKITNNAKRVKVK